MSIIGEDITKKTNVLRYHPPSKLKKASIIHHIETKDGNGRIWIATDRNRLTGEIRTHVRPGCPRNFLDLHARQVAAAWGRPTEADMLKKLVEIWRP